MRNQIIIKGSFLILYIFLVWNITGNGMQVCAIDNSTCTIQSESNIKPFETKIPKMITTTLVVGATGETGKHVVAQLLQQGQAVRAIVRSKSSLQEKLNSIDGFTYEKHADSLSVIEGAVLDINNEDISKHVEGCDAVVSCLGHNMNFSGIFGHPRRLVKDSVVKLTSSMTDRQKFILMGSEGVANPLGGDDVRSCGERTMLSILRNLVPPHADNEEAADFLANKLGTAKMGWTVIRPTNLIDGPATDYQLFNKPQGSLFGTEEATRANVAKCIVDMILSDDKWNQYKFKMPVLHDAKKE